MHRTSSSSTATYFWQRCSRLTGLYPPSLHKWPIRLAADFVESLARPGANVTGFTNFESEIGGKLAGRFSRRSHRTSAGRFHSLSANCRQYSVLRAAEAAAPALRMTVIAAGVHNAAEIEPAITSFAAGSDGGVIAAPHVIIGPSRDLIAALATRHRLPCVYPFRSWSQRMAASYPAGSMLLTYFAGPLSTLIASCAAPSRPICRCKHRPNTSRRSISRPPRRSASRCRLHCSPAPTR